MTQRQKRFDLERFDRIGLITELRVGTGIASDGAQVRGSTLKSVLHAIDNYIYDKGRTCYASAETLGNDTGFGERTIRRAIDVLERLGLIIKEERKGRTPHLIIVWSELEQLARKQKSRVAAKIEARRTPEPAFARSATPDSEAATPDSEAATPDSEAATPDSGSDEPIRKELKRNEPAGDAMVLVRKASPSLPRDWSAAADEFFRLEDLGQAKSLATKAYLAGESLAAWVARVRSAIDTAKHPTNAKVLGKPIGAAVVFLRDGTWPASGVKSIEEIRASQETAIVKQSERRLEIEIPVEYAKTRIAIARQRNLDPISNDAFALAKEALAKRYGDDVVRRYCI
jgi:hypothetical protein